MGSSWKVGGAGGAAPASGPRYTPGVAFRASMVAAGDEGTAGDSGEPQAGRGHRSLKGAVTELATRDREVFKGTVHPKNTCSDLYPFVSSYI